MCVQYMLMMSIVVKYGVGIVVHEILTLNTIYIKECPKVRQICVPQSDNKAHHTLFYL